MSTTMADISAAINQIATKKQDLHKSFLHLQSQQPSSFNLPLSWPDIDSYFTTIQSSLQSKFNLLQTLNPQPDSNPSPTRPELKSFCLNSDGLGLNRFIITILDQENQESILDDLVVAYRFAPDAAAMVLDLVSGFYGSGCVGDEGGELGLFRKGCLVMLEGLVCLKPVVSVEVKYKAMEIAVEWNRMRGCGGGDDDMGNQENVLGFLLLVGAFGIVDRFSVDEIVDWFVGVAMDRRTVRLCRMIVPASNVNDIIQKLIDKDMHVTAVNFSIALQKTKEFSPVGLLEERKLRSLSVIEEAHKNAEDLYVCNDVMMKEINTLKSIIKCIEENQLQTEYPKDSVVELVNRLENEVENRRQTLVNSLQLRKQPVRAAVLKNHLRAKPKKLKKSKKPKLKKGQLAADSAAGAPPVQTAKFVEEFYAKRPEFLPDHVGKCHNTPRESGPTGSSAPYASSSASLGGSTKADTGYKFPVKRWRPPPEGHSNGWLSE